MKFMKQIGKFVKRKRVFSVLTMLFGLIISYQVFAQESVDEFEFQPVVPMVNSLVLRDQGANEVLDLLEKLENKKILRQQNLPKVRINFNSHGPIEKEDAISAVRDLLSINGIEVTTLYEDVLRAAPATEAKEHAPQIIMESTLGIKPSQNIFSKIFKLNFIDSKDAAKLAKAIATPKIGSQTPIESSNSIMMTDTLANLQHFEQLLIEADTPLALQGDIQFYQLRYSNAKDIEDRLNSLKKGSLKKYFSSSTFEADTNTNQLIAIVHPNNVPLLNKLVAKFDVDVKPLNRSEVFQLKHANAKDITELLKSLIKGTSEKDPKKDDKPADPRSELLKRLREARQKKAGAAEAKKDDKSNNEGFSDIVTVEADERTNAIVAFGTPQDLDQIGGLIDKLDSVLPQVRIEVVIAEVTLREEDVSGLERFGINYRFDSVNPFVIQQPVADGASAPDATLDRAFKTGVGGVGPARNSGANPSVDFIGSLNKFSIDAVFEIAKRDSDVTILSSPTLVTTHNKEASFKTGEERAVETSITESLAANDSTRTSIEYKEIFNEITVTPLIGDDDIIELEIDQNLSVVSDDTDRNRPIISTRRTESFVSVANKDLVVLSGIQTLNESYSKGKLWGLGYLPILGDLLFSPKTKNKIKQEVIIFLRPEIIRSSDEYQKVTDDVLRNSELESDIQYYTRNDTFNYNSECEPEKKKRKSRWSRRKGMIF